MHSRLVTAAARKRVSALQCKGNHRAHRIIWSWYTGRWRVGCYVWYSEKGTGRGRSLPRSLLAVPNVTVHPSMANVGLPITLFLYSGPLLCGFNVPIRGLTVWCVAESYVISPTYFQTSSALRYLLWEWHWRENTRKMMMIIIIISCRSYIRWVLTADNGL